MVNGGCLGSVCSASARTSDGHELSEHDLHYGIDRAVAVVHERGVDDLGLAESIAAVG
jgi:hypothetical protein